MAILTHAQFHFNRLMVILIFAIWDSEAPRGPGEPLKRPGEPNRKTQTVTQHDWLMSGFDEYLRKAWIRYSITTKRKTLKAKRFRPCNLVYFHQETVFAVVAKSCMKTWLHVFKNISCRETQLNFQIYCKAKFI